MFDTVILIPYRDRKEHLDYFLKDLWPRIKSLMPNVKLVIIEQEEGKLFNRGKILNIGFKEYLDKTTFYITHDIDIIPTNEIISNHYTNENSIYDILSAHNESLGGIVKLSSNIIKNINGFPNDIWGWGIEDRALHYRCKIMDNNINYSGLVSTQFKKLTHKSNGEVYKSEKLVLSEKWRKKYIDTLSTDEKHEMIAYSGINNLDYTILERYDLEENVELIKVSI